MDDEELLSNLEYPISALADVVARVESLRGRMPPSGMISEGERQVDGLFESLLAEAFEA